MLNSLECQVDMGSLSLSSTQNVVHNISSSDEDQISRNYYALASAKSCGWLMLIGKLLNLETAKRPSQCSNPLLHSWRLADKLLSKVSKSGIVVTYPQNENPLAFVLQLIDQAKQIASRPCDYHGILQTYAKRLIEAIAVCQNTDDKNSYTLLEKHWMDFSINYLREKLHNQMHKQGYDK